MTPRVMQSGGTLMPGAPLYEKWRESLKTVPPGQDGICPFAHLFPMIVEDDIRVPFRESLKSEGQHHPVVLWRGTLLDGRNRARDLIELEKPISFVLFIGTERQALDFVSAENFARRHLTDKQRARIAARMANMRAGDNQHSERLVPSGGVTSLFSGLEQSEPEAEEQKPIVSIPEAAQITQSTHSSVERAAVIERKGTPELQAAVDYGPISLAAGATLAELPPTEQKAIIDALPRDDKGKLTPEAKKQLAPILKEVRADTQAEKKKKRDEKEAKLGAEIRALPDVKAGLIISDFEWHFKVRSEETGMDRHAANHYVTAKAASTPEAIVERQRERMIVCADDCIHLMWTTAAFLEVALKVMALQGFKYVSHFVWIKPGIGTGFWVRESHELLLIGVRGKVPCPAMGDQFNSAIEAPRGGHSEKPDFQYEIAEKYFPSLPKVELNARRQREGWIQWGNEAPEPDQASLSIEPSEAAA